MAAEAIKIRAAAAKLYKETGDSAIEGYKTMPLDDLKEHIARIERGDKGTAKGEASVNGASRPKGKSASTAAPAKPKGKAAVAPAPATTPKGKGKTSAVTSAPAKSTSRKSSPAKGKAATGTAKRPTAAAAKGKASTAKGKVTPAKGRTTAKSGTAKSTTTRRPRAAANAPARVDIDNKAVDWKAEWNGGKTGKRAEVIAGLRKYKGDKDKTFDLLVGKARTFYKGKTKAEAEKLLRWLIGRVAFDFVTATGQHEPGVRAAYGTAMDNKNVARRLKREEERKAREKEARAAKRQASAAGKGKTAARPRSTAKAKGKS